MGKIRVAKLGDEKSEKEEKRRAEARRQTKASKKEKTEGETSDEVKPEFQNPTDASENITEKSGKKSSKEVKQHIHSKKYVESRKLVDPKKLYPLSEAIDLVKKTSITKFDGTVELHLNLNPIVLGEKGEKKDYRGSVNLPHGTGKQIKVVVADDKIITEISEGKINFDVLVAHPSMMPKLARVAKILGPKGLMPNPKTGTISPDPEKRAKELSSGEVNFKTEPNNPIIHMPIGKVSFETKKLTENIEAMFKVVGKTKIVKATLASTMGPGIKLAVA